MQSMTGFGHYEEICGDEKVICEIRSVNHRYLDLNIKMPRLLSSFEGRVREIVKAKAFRGKVDVFLSYEAGMDTAVEITYHPEIARKYLECLASMEREFFVKNDLGISTLARFPDVFEVSDATPDMERLEKMVSCAASGALDAFLESRTREGERLCADLSGKLEQAAGLVDQVEARGPQIIEEYREKLRQKVSELMEEGSLDESRLAMEIVLFADKMSVDEEIVRLKSHIKEATDCLKATEPIGRKMDFLAQELNREANTILSKSTDAQLANLGIELKTLIEKIREQIQNIE